MATVPEKSNRTTVSSSFTIEPSVLERGKQKAKKMGFKSFSAYVSKLVADDLDEGTGSDHEEIVETLLTALQKIQKKSKSAPRNKSS